MIIRIKLNAGALQYAIFISILIALLVFSFISMTFLQKQLSVKSNFYKRAIDNVNEAVWYAQTNEVDYQNPFRMVNNEEKTDSTVIIRSTWGVFDLVKVTSRVHHESFQKSAILGGFIENRPALYLQDLNRPLVLVGDSRIEGNVFLPEKGVKRGSIGGKSYYGSELIYGNRASSGSELPKIVNREHLFNFRQTILEDDHVELLDNFDISSLTRSFFENTGLISSGETLILDKFDLKGNLVIHSDSLIYVSKDSYLEDVILIAPQIIIEEGTKGIFQALATKRIEVGEQCLLEYPSSLILIEAEQQVDQEKETGQIVVHKNSEIRGVVAYLTNHKEFFNSTQIYIEKDALIKGEIYSEMNVEISGTVYGTVTSKGFVTMHNGAKYQNHIYNGSIVEHHLPKQYAGLQIEDLSRANAKWLY